MTYSKKIIEQQHQKTVLANGLTVVSLSMPDVSSINIEVLVKVGSRYESQELSGMAHFIEHMNFKGTTKRTAKDIAEEFDAIGGYINAYTTKENTVYSAKVLKEFFPLAVEVLADIMFHSVYQNEEIEREKGVVLQELAQTEDAPEEMVFEYFADSSFPHQALGRSILGVEKNILAFTRAQIIEFIKKYYIASNIIISVAGDCSHQELLKLIEEKFAPHVSDKKITYEPAKYKGGYVYKENPELSQIHLVVGYEGIDFNSKDYYKFEMLANILGGSISSRLFQEIREKRGLVYSVASFSQYFLDSGIFGIMLSSSEDKINESLEVLSQEIIKLTYSITQQEIDRCLAQVKAALLMGRETPDNWVNILAANYACYGRYVSCEEIWQGYAAVTIDQLHDLAKKIFDRSKPATIAALGNRNVLPNYQQMHEMLSV